MPGKVTLSITEGPMKGRSVDFDRHDTFIFGRDPDCHARLARSDTTASRHHFMLEVNPPAACVRDLGSLNGTSVNGKLIGKRDDDETAEEGRARRFPEVDLKDGDTLKVGASVFVLHVEAPAYCGSCNGMIEHREKGALKAPNGVHFCATCRAEFFSQHKELPDAPLPPTCYLCGKDVAAEISGRGDYVCQTCQKHEGQDPEAILDRKILDRILKQIPGYSIEKQLGAGGMGEVHLAHRLTDHEPVAIKLMLAKMAVSEQMRSFFSREIEMTQRLRHENVVSLFEHGSVGAAFYFVMEFCRDGSIDRLMAANGGRLSIEQAMPLAMSALAGLAFIHENGFVHRDLKPQNLLIAAPGVAKVSDLGLAKSFDGAGLSGMTMTGQKGGSVLFMPREQITNFKRVKPVSDVFSFGAVVYNMLTGLTPRDYPRGEDPQVIVLSGPSVPIRQRDATIPKRIAEVIDRACALQWKDRFANAGEMREALSRAIGDPTG